MITIPNSPKDSRYKIYYRVVYNKPYAMDVGDKINIENGLLHQQMKSHFLKKLKMVVM